eukprot:2490197-Rhodomonas_salina.1
MLRQSVVCTCHARAHTHTHGTSTEESVGRDTCWSSRASAPPTLPVTTAPSVHVSAVSGVE